MSVVGQALPIRASWATSGLPLVETELRTFRIDSFVPSVNKVDPCGCEIDDKIRFDRLLDSSIVEVDENAAGSAES
jgi:hypothetical protein